MNSKSQTTIKLRQGKIKEMILEHLQKMPIIQLVCEKTGIARATFYRWMDQSPDFKKAVEEASQEGHRRIGDLAESKLIHLINDNNLGAIIFYLRSQNKKYRPAIVAQVGPVDPADDEMTEKEKEHWRKFIKANAHGCKACNEIWDKAHKELNKGLNKEYGVIK